MKNWASVAVLAALGPFAAVAQHEMHIGPIGTLGFSEPKPVPAPVSGAAYSADEVSERIKTNGDGNRMVQYTTHRKVYRDMEGRLRIETPLPMEPPRGKQLPKQPVMLVEITDAVGGYNYTLDLESRVAHRVRLTSQVPRSNNAAAELSTHIAVPVADRTAYIPVGPGILSVDPNTPRKPSPGEKAALESLGRQVVGGVLADGLRWTVRMGASTSDGSGFMTTETWTEPNLKVVVLTKITDPAAEMTTRLTNISRTTPVSTLFYVPSDFGIIDEAGPFTIHYSAQ